MSVKIINIYLGVNFDKNGDDIKKKIFDVCKRNNVKITQMALAVSDYSIRVKGG